MKSCPACLSTYSDDSLNYCLLDRTPLEGNGSMLQDSSEVSTLARRSPDELKRYLDVLNTYTTTKEFMSGNAQTRREKMLRHSLELVKSEVSNEDAVFEIVNQALDAELFDLAKDAMRAFSPDSNMSLCSAVTKLFEADNWPYLNEEFAGYCAERTIGTTECRCFAYFGDHQPDNRSEALANLGLYFLGKGEETRAFSLWKLADEPRDIDQAIADFSSSS
jgi:hypothetical protein